VAAIHPIRSILPAEQRIAEFRRSTGSLRFKCITGENSREKFAEALNDRLVNPALINQKQTPLCGPAAFMYCIASDRRDAYANYVLDLAEYGEGRLGELVIKPSAACCDATDTGGAHPVDWVALASLRDASNNFRSMSNAGKNIAGMTFGGELQGWFEATKWFTGGVVNTSRWAWSQSLENLIDINSRSDSHVCLLIRSAIIQKSSPSFADIGINKFGKETPKSLTGFPDHWVVLKSRIQIGMKTPQWPGALSADDVKTHRLHFNFWSWGEEELLKVNRRIPNITTAQFLPYYYGYVSAKR